MPPPPPSSPLLHPSFIIFLLQLDEVCCILFLSWKLNTAEHPCLSVIKYIKRGNKAVLWHARWHMQHKANTFLCLVCVTLNAKGNDLKMENVQHCLAQKTRLAYGWHKVHWIFAIPGNIRPCDWTSPRDNARKSGSFTSTLRDSPSQAAYELMIIFPYGPVSLDTTCGHEAQCKYRVLAHALFPTTPTGQTIAFYYSAARTPWLDLTENEGTVTRSYDDPSGRICRVLAHAKHISVPMTIPFFCFKQRFYTSNFSQK